jgi:hypothetical protein
MGYDVEGHSEGWDMMLRDTVRGRGMQKGPPCCFCKGSHIYVLKNLHFRIFSQFEVCKYFAGYSVHEFNEKARLFHYYLSIRLCMLFYDNARLLQYFLPYGNES